MPESIYIATSPQYEGIVKIGRTDRPVQERMDELSKRDYGLEGEVGDTEWEVANVIIVDDNVAAEAMLHQHPIPSEYQTAENYFIPMTPRL